MTERALFVTWDGPQVHYLESLFVPIFSRLRTHGIAVDVLQFGWGDQDGARAACTANGIRYRRVEIGRKWGALGPLFSAVFGGRAVREAAAAFNSTVLMPRSLFAGLAALSGQVGLPILFDSDGLLADERREARAGWSPEYALLRQLESTLVHQADHVLVRTVSARDMLARRGRRDASAFTIVRNGRDPKIFKRVDARHRAEMRCTLGLANRHPLLIYAGSVGPQYESQQMGRIAETMRGSHLNCGLLVLTGEIERARKAFGPAANWAQFRTAAPEEVPAILSAGDFGLSLRSSTLAMRGVAPIKLGEYLLSGMPVIGSPGIGPTEPAERAGVFVDASLPDVELLARIEDLLRRGENARADARQVGETAFSLDAAVNDYREAFATLRNRSTTRGAQVASE